MTRLILFFLLSFHVVLVQYPSGFQEESFGSWILPMAVVFDHTNKMDVIERDGRLFSFSNN